MVPSLGRLARWRQILAMLLPRLGLLDQQNCPTHARRWLAGASRLEIQSVRSDLPECAYEGLMTMAGQPTGLTDVLEIVRGYGPIIRTARENPIEKQSRTADQLSADTRMAVVSFDSDGYRVEFQLGRIRPPETGTVASGRPCHASDIRTTQHTQKLACDAELGPVIDRYMEPYATTLHQHTYTRDFQAQSLTLTVESCEGNPNGEDL